MERHSLIAQLYGYAVCLIALVTLLVTIPNFIEDIFARAEPLQSESGRYGPYGGSLTSFEAFRATYGREGPLPEGGAARDTLTEAELRTRYEALRADRIASVRYSATRGLVTKGLLIAIAAGLFVMHWRWLRRRPAAEGA